MDKEEKLWKCEYLQQSFTYLTEENLDWLEQHCEKTIRCATGNTLKEHIMVLELIEQHKQYLSLRADYLRRMKASNEVLRKQGYISKEKIREKIKELKEEIKLARKEKDLVIVAELELQVDILKQILEEK